MYVPSSPLPSHWDPLSCSFSLSPLPPLLLFSLLPCCSLPLFHCLHSSLPTLFPPFPSSPHQALTGLAMSKRVAQQLVRAGGVGTLLALLSSSNPNIAAAAAGTLWNLSVGDEHKASAVTALRCREGQHCCCTSSRAVDPVSGQRAHGKRGYHTAGRHCYCGQRLTLDSVSGRQAQGKCSRCYCSAGSHLRAACGGALG